MQNSHSLPLSSFSMSYCYTLYKSEEISPAVVSSVLLDSLLFCSHLVASIQSDWGPAQGKEKRADRNFDFSKVFPNISWNILSAAIRLNPCLTFSQLKVVSNVILLSPSISLVWKSISNAGYKSVCGETCGTVHCGIKWPHLLLLTVCW